MRRVAHQFGLLAIALALALASVGHATARHQAQGATSMVICTGYGLVRITLDADGHPIEQSLPCPDCILAQGALPAGPLALIAPSTTRSTAVTRAQSLIVVSTAGLWHLSRAPPALA